MSKPLPVLPIRNSVLFPFVHMPFSVGRPLSMAAVEAALESEGRELIVVSQRESVVEEPAQKDLYGVGTKAVIKKAVRGEDGRIQLIVQGLERVRIDAITSAEPFVEAAYTPIPVQPEKTAEVEALQRELADLAVK